MRKPPNKMAVLIAVLGVVMALASIASVVPRIRLVEAIGLFATAFAAGAAVAITVASVRGRPR